MMRSTKQMLIALFFAAGALIPATSQAGTKIDDPVKFVRAVYAAMQKNSSYQPPQDIYSPRMVALIKLDEKEMAGYESRLDSDFWSNSQDPAISDVRVSKIDVEHALDRMIVIVKFKQGGGENENHFFFEKTQAGWKLDDEVSGGPSGGLSDVLSLTHKYGGGSN